MKGSGHALLTLGSSPPEMLSKIACGMSIAYLSSATSSTTRIVFAKFGFPFRSSISTLPSFPVFTLFFQERSAAFLSEVSSNAVVDGMKTYLTNGEVFRFKRKRVSHVAVRSDERKRRTKE